MPSSNPYRLCCCHVAKWALAIGVIEFILLLLNLGVTIKNKLDGSYGEGNFFTGVVYFAIGLIIVPLLIYGVLKEVSWCLIPHIVVQVRRV